MIINPCTFTLQVNIWFLLFKKEKKIKKRNNKFNNRIIYIFEFAYGCLEILKVINETLRLGNGDPGLFRKVLKDIQVNGKGIIYYKLIIKHWSLLKIAN